jgi:TRAP-type C4-dicarboxylate transport system permease small subunit
MILLFVIAFLILLAFAAFAMFGDDLFKKNSDETVPATRTPDGVDIFND